MKRSVLLLALGFSLSRFLPAAPAAVGPTQTVETDNAIITLAAKSGDLVGLEWKDPKLQLIAEPRLGENFRLLLPKPGNEACYFNSREQTVGRIEVAADGVTCFYDGLKNDGERLPVKVEYRIRTVGGQVQFSIRVDNPTSRKLAEVFYAIIGGQKGIQERRDTETMIPGRLVNAMPRAFTQFGAQHFGLGPPYFSEANFLYPSTEMAMGWMDVFNRRAGWGYYYANQDPENRVTCLHLEVRPITKTEKAGDDWGLPSELPPGEPIGLSMGWVNFPYTAKGVFSAGPIALQVHGGDWHAASHIYRSWFDQHFAVKRPLSWLRKEMAWQSITMATAEDEIVNRFSDLPRIAAEGKKYGVTTLEIDGWDMGGQDRGFPQYRPSPRLGTPEEFRQALAEMRKMGVHPLIFANVAVADTATPLFRDNFSRYAVTGRWAPDWGLAGWGYGTISARAGLTTHHMTAASPAHPAFREFLMKQYIDLVKDGADGFELDKTGGVSGLDFNPLLPVSPDRSMIGGTLAVFKEVLTKARAIVPDFGLASEIFIDRTFPYVDVSYGGVSIKTDWECPALKYTFPEWTAGAFAKGPLDFNALNNGMRYGMVWDVAPQHYQRSMDEVQTRPLSRYVQELMRIRGQYRDLLFQGRFDETFGVAVKAGADIRYSVFGALDPADKRRACVVVNLGDGPEKAEVSFDGADGRQARVSAPFEVDRTGVLPLHLTIPAERCAVVVVE